MWYQGTADFVRLTLSGVERCDVRGLDISQRVLPHAAAEFLRSRGCEQVQLRLLKMLVSWSWSLLQQEKPEDRETCIISVARGDQVVSPPIYHGDVMFIFSMTVVRQEGGRVVPDTSHLHVESDSLCTT